MKNAQVFLVAFVPLICPEEIRGSKRTLGGSQLLIGIYANKFMTDHQQKI